ncbi:hypothetical protein GCM10009689_17600 [Brevibacterium antiquum]|uniref:hypothetical protein n=1 Tax=Brevibacterium antiquum TaxID=234835 RepID=UPI0018DF2530|nr:hypothetical protein [Brevibacterium antiquum]
MNSSKNKGDRGEREVLALFETRLADHLVPGAQRGKNAGQPHDRGDLFVLDGFAVQVKYFKASNLGGAVRQAAYGAAEQATNGFKNHGVGMSIIEGARKGSVRVLASYTPDMALALPGVEHVAQFGTISKLKAWITDDAGPYGYRAYPRSHRWATLTSDPVTIVGTFEAFETSYLELADANTLPMTAPRKGDSVELV